MRPAAILWFERLLLTALAIDLINNLVAVAGPGDRQHVAPIGPSASLAIAVLPVLVGLVLWYFVARKASNIARWVTTVLVVIGTIGFAVTGFSGNAVVSQPMFLVAALAELLKLAAVAFLFTAPATAWFANKRPV